MQIVEHKLKSFNLCNSIFQFFPKHKDDTLKKTESIYPYGEMLEARITQLIATSLLPGAHKKGEYIHSVDYFVLLVKSDGYQGVMSCAAKRLHLKFKNDANHATPCLDHIKEEISARFDVEKFEEGLTKAIEETAYYKVNDLNKCF